jgi:hypothetical protein
VEGASRNGAVSRTAIGVSQASSGKSSRESVVLEAPWLPRIATGPSRVEQADQIAAVGEARRERDLAELGGDPVEPFPGAVREEI